MNLYLTEKEAKCLRDVCGQWMELMEESAEDIVTPMLKDGLGSALHKLYNGRNGSSLYQKYAEEKKKRKYYRKCGICGERHEQSDMIRTNESSNGWLCVDCYNSEHPEYDTDEW